MQIITGRVRKGTLVSQEGNRIKRSSESSTVILAPLTQLLRVPWTARRSNQSILKEINPGIALEGMMLKLKLQYFGTLCDPMDSTVHGILQARILVWVAFPFSRGSSQPRD